MGYVFISYSNKNQPKADQLRDLLNREGIQTWMAPGDIPAGSKYAEVIVSAIKECTCFVLLLSEDAQNSQWVAKEVERAINYRKTLVPVQIEDVILNNEFELYVSTAQIIAVPKIDPETEEMQMLLARLRGFFEKETKGEENPVTGMKKGMLEQEEKPEIGKTEKNRKPRSTSSLLKNKRFWKKQNFFLGLLCLVAVLGLLWFGANHLNNGNTSATFDESAELIQGDFEFATFSGRQFDSSFWGYGADLTDYLKDELDGAEGEVTFRFGAPFPDNYEWFVRDLYGSDPDYEYDSDPSHGNYGYLYHALETAGSYDLGGETGRKYASFWGIAFDIDVYVGRSVDYAKEYNLSGVNSKNFVKKITDALWKQTQEQTKKANEQKDKYSVGPDGTKFHYYYESASETGTVMLGDQKVAYLDVLTADVVERTFTQYDKEKTETWARGYDRVRYIFTFNGQYANMLRVEVKDNYGGNELYQSLDYDAQKQVSKDAIDELLQYFYSVS